MSVRSCRTCGVEMIMIRGGRPTCKDCAVKHKREYMRDYCRRRRCLSKDETGIACRKCGTVIAQDNTSTRRYVCRRCSNSYAMSLYNKDREKGRARQRLGNQRLRDEILTAYGGCCACCGEATPEFLTIDHIHNNGAEHRRLVPAAKNLYQLLRREGFPKEDYQLLCMNCNFAKGKYGVCPHAVKKAEVA